MSDFKSLETTQAGNIGERIVREQLARWGEAVYPAPPMSHPVDFLTWKDGEFTAVEVKTYPRYFSDTITGIDRADYVTYRNLSIAHRMPVRLFFVDRHERTIYGHRLSYLEPFKFKQDGKICFPLHAMRVVRSLTDAEVQELNEFSTVNYSQYTHLPRYFVTSTEGA